MNSPDSLFAMPSEPTSKWGIFCALCDNEGRSKILTAIAAIILWYSGSLLQFIRLYCWHDLGLTFWWFVSIENVYRITKFAIINNLIRMAYFRDHSEDVLKK